MYIILFIENLETMRQKFVHGNFYTYKCSSQYCKRNMDKKEPMIETTLISQK